MKALKILTTACFVLIVHGKLLAQTEKTTNKEATAKVDAQTTDPVDDFLSRYQSYLENKTQPAKETKKTAPKNLTATQKTVTQEDVTRAFNAVQLNNYYLKNNAPPIPDPQYHLYQQQAQPLMIDYLDKQLDLKIANSGPATVAAGARLNSQSEKLYIVKKAIADKKVLDKEAEEKEKTEKTSNNEK